MQLLCHIVITFASQKNLIPRTLHYHPYLVVITPANNLLHIWPQQYCLYRD